MSDLLRVGFVFLETSDLSGIESFEFCRNVMHQLPIECALWLFS